MLMLLMLMHLNRRMYIRLLVPLMKVPIEKAQLLLGIRFPRYWMITTNANPIFVDRRVIISLPFLGRSQLLVGLCRCSQPIVLQYLAFNDLVINNLFCKVWAYQLLGFFTIFLLDRMLSLAALLPLHLLDLLGLSGYLVLEIDIVQKIGHLLLVL